MTYQPHQREDLALKTARVKRSKEMAIYDRRVVVVQHGKFAQEVHPMEVRVLARAEGYAMVRRKGGSTFAVPEKELRPVEASAAIRQLAALRQEAHKE